MCLINGIKNLKVVCVLTPSDSFVLFSQVNSKWVLYPCETNVCKGQERKYLHTGTH